MKKIKKYVPYLVATGAIVVSGLTQVSAATDTDTNNLCAGPRPNNAQHEQMIKAVESKDYSAWLVAIGDDERAQNLKSKINADNFDDFIKMHELRRSGDEEGAEAIRQQLGLPDRPERGSRGGRQVTN